MIWTQQDYLRTSGTGSSFEAEIAPPIIQHNLNYHTLTVKVAEEVQASRQGKLYLMYSGGVDSEYILSIFLSLKIDIIPVIVRLNPNYNEHDIKYAFDFCRSKNLNPMIVDINFDDFVKSGKIVDIANEYQIAAYQFPSTFYAMSQLDGTVITGNHGPPHVFLDKATNTWHVDEIEPYHTVLKYFDKNKIHGCPFFLVYTAEQYLAFLEHPVMQDLANHKYPGKLGNNSTKKFVYNDISNFNLVDRVKFTGYENIETSEIFQHPNLKIFDEFKKQWWGQWSEPYDDFIARMKK
jgi:hypothetical protein